MSSKLFFVIAFSFLTSLPAWAVNGAIVGNGGGAVITGNSAQLYDLYEAWHPLLYGRAKPEIAADQSVSRTISWALTRMIALYPESGKRVQAIIATWSKQIDFDSNPVPPRSISKAMAVPSFPDVFITPAITLLWDETIPTFPDSAPPFVPKGSTFETVAYWNDPFAKLFIQADRYIKLDRLSRAALFIHEALFGLTRQTVAPYDQDSLTNSVQVRRFVGSIFSTDTCLVSIPTAEERNSNCQASN